LSSLYPLPTRREPFRSVIEPYRKEGFFVMMEKLPLSFTEYINCTIFYMMDSSIKGNRAKSSAKF